MKRFLIYHLPLILYAAMVLGVSSISNLKSPHIRNLATDKIAHFTEYAVFALLAFRSMSRLSRRPGPWFGIVAALLFLAVFAVVDETLQRFIPGRIPDIFDYLSDMTGGAIVLGLLGLLAAQKRRSV